MTDNIWVNILGIVYIVLAVVELAVIMIQQSKQSGLGALSGESVFQGNMGNTKNSIYNKITIVVSLLLVILTVVLNVLAR